MRRLTSILRAVLALLAVAAAVASIVAFLRRDRSASAIPAARPDRRASAVRSGPSNRPFHFRNFVPRRMTDRIRWSALAMMGIVIVSLIVVFNAVPSDMFRTSLFSLQQKGRIRDATVSRIGATYVLGATGPSSYDCSGLALTVMKEAVGVTLPRISRDQAKVGRDVSVDTMDVGDLVFFNTFGDPGTVTHVGVITKREGSRVWMTNANSYLNKVVEEEIIRGSNPNYWGKTLLFAREITEFTKDETPSPSTNPIPPSGGDLAYAGEDPFPQSEPDPPAPPPPPRYPNGPFPDVDPNSANAPAITFLKNQGVIGGYPDGMFRPAKTVSRVELLKFAFLAFDVTPELRTNPFFDVAEDHWGRGYVATAANRSWVSGYEDGSFGPDRTVTRAEAAKILLNVAGTPPRPPATKPYRDVAINAWYAPYVQIVKEQALMTLNGSFLPGQGMTRAEVAEFVYRAMQNGGLV